MKLASCIEGRLFTALTSLCILVSLDIQKNSSVAAATDENHGLLLANMDRSVRPGDDFYRYANGAWLKRAVVPEEHRYVDPFATDVDDSNNDLTPQTTDTRAAIAAEPTRAWTFPAKDGRGNR